MRKLFLSVLLSFLLVAPVYAQRDLQKVRISDFSGGQVSAANDDILEDNQGTYYQNLELDQKGKLIKRKGQSLFCTSSATVFSGLGRYDPDASTKYIAIASGVTVSVAESTDDEWILLNRSNDLTAGLDTEFIQARDLFFVFNGTDYTSWYDSTEWFAGTGWVAGSPPTATTGAWLRNYLFLSGNPNYPDWIFFSNNLVPQLFDAGDVFRANTGDGQVVNRIEPFKLNELIIYKERSIFVLDITGTTPLDDWTLQPISKQVGCIAPRSVVNVGNDHWFLSSSPVAVRSLVRTSFDKLLVEMVSTPIQDMFDGSGDPTINLTYVENACAVLFDNKYFLAIPTGASTVNNTVVVFDFVSKAWSVIDGWYPAAWIVTDNKLYCMNSEEGRVVRCFTGTIGDFPSPSYASEPTTEIEFDYTSKAYDWDNPENFKIIDSMEVEFDSTGDYTATLSIDLDNGGFQEVGTVNLAGDAITLPENLPFTLSSGGVARKTFHLQQYGEFKKMRVKVEQSGISEECILQRITLFAQVRPWRRE